MDEKGTRKKPVATYKKLTPAEEEKLLFEAREKARMDYEDRMDDAYERGATQGKIEIVVKLMIKRNVDIDEAMEIMDLDKEYKPQVIEKFNELKKN